MNDPKIGDIIECDCPQCLHVGSFMVRIERVGPQPGAYMGLGSCNRCGWEDWHRDEVSEQ